MHILARVPSWVLPTVIALALTLLAGTYKLSEAPAIWFDEGFYTQLGVNVAQVHQFAFQTAPGEFVHSSYISVGYPLIYPLALSYALFGVGVLQGRAVMVVFILLFVCAAYWCARQLFGPWQAAWSALLLSSFAELYGNGKSVLGEVPGLFFLTTALVMLVYLEKSNYRSVVWCALLGLATGLCVATKPIFLLLPAALLLTLLVRRKRVTLSWKGFLTGLAVLSIPLLYWAYTQLGPDMTIYSLLRDYLNPYSTQGAPTVTMQTVAQNARRFFTESTPAYTGLLIFLWGVALFIKRKVSKVSSTELSTFFFCLFIIVAYLRLPGWYRYLFPATAMEMLFLVPTVITIYGYIQERFSFSKKYLCLPYVFLLLLILVQTYQVFFASYVAQYYTSTRTQAVATFFGSLPQGSSIFLYDTPELSVLYPSRNYYQYLQPAAGVTIGSDQLSLLERGIPDFVAVSSDVTVDPGLFVAYKPYVVVDRYKILKKLI